MFDLKNKTINQLIFDGHVGLEKESLRITGDGRFAHTRHPFPGEKNIVRDFSENQVEINTGVCDSLEAAIQEMRAYTLKIQKTLSQMNPREYLWPNSNPPYIENEEDIPIAIYEMDEIEKRIYREYLAVRYGRYKMAFSGIHVNYSFFYGATNDNVQTFSQLDAHRIPGIKLFMGSSTGNMLVDGKEALERIFSTVKLPLMVHCEDTDIINHNMEEARKAWGEDPQVSLHTRIRSEEACLASSRKAVELAKKYGTRLHIAHLSTAEELELIGENITAEACVGHLYFTELDYQRLGTRIKVNPSIKTPVDQFLLRQALTDGRITVVGTDHAPHLLEQKQGGCVRAASGMPMIQFSLVTMLELVDEKVLPLERMVELMCHNPARLFGVERRGFLRKGYRADMVIVRPRSPWTVTKDVIQSKCGWSPVEGHEYQWRVERTLCNGKTVYADGCVNTDVLGEEIVFNHAS